MFDYFLLLSMPLQDLPLLSLQDSMLSQSKRINKRKSRGCFGEGLDTECTPTDLIQQWSPSHKHQRLSSKGKENEGNQFVLARRSRRRKESTSGRKHLWPPLSSNVSPVTLLNCQTWTFSIIISLGRHFMGPPAWRAASQDPLLPPYAGSPQDVHRLQALASLSVSPSTQHWELLMTKTVFLPGLVQSWILLSLVASAAGVTVVICLLDALAVLKIVKSSNPDNDAEPKLKRYSPQAVCINYSPFKYLELKNMFLSFQRCSTVNGLFPKMRATHFICFCRHSMEIQF